MFCAYAGCPLAPVFGKHRLNLVPQLLFDDCRMLSRKCIALMSNLAAVNAVLKHQIERPTGEFLATILGAIGSYPLLTPYPYACKLVLEIANRFERKIAPVDID